MFIEKHLFGQDKNLASTYCFLERSGRDELSLEQSLPVLFARLRSDYRDVRLRRGFVQTEEFGHTLFCAALDLEVVVLIVSAG